MSLDRGVEFKLRGHTSQARTARKTSMHLHGLIFLRLASDAELETTVSVLAVRDQRVCHSSIGAATLSTQSRQAAAARARRGHMIPRTAVARSIHSLKFVIPLCALLLGLASCAENSKPVAAAPGEGITRADSMVRVVHPRIGETISAPNPDNPEKYLMDRLNDAAGSDRWLQFSQPEFTRSSAGVENSVSLRFADGSTLRFHMSPSRGEGTGLQLVALEIVR
jgi:hypothetical protein